MDKSKMIKELSALARDLDTYKQLMNDTTQKCIKDIMPIKNESVSDKSNGSNTKLSFSKSYNNPASIEENKEHEFARKHTLIHLQSNSVCTWIPKNSCSTLRFSIAKANGAISGIDDIEWIHKNNYSFNASNKELLAAKYTFTILRNPFKRLLSFYCDKLCNKGISTNDRSYEVAKSSMGTDAKTTFSDFIEILWRNPSLKRANEHIQDQCDFLVYKNYHDYLALENYQETQSTIREKTGLIMEDVRQFNSIHTSYGCEDSVQIDYNSPAESIGSAMKNLQKPSAKNMYNSDLIRKVGFMYLHDILLYRRTVREGEDEMKYWLKFMA